MTLPIQHKKRLYVALALIFLAGAFLRVYQLNDQPYWMDEGYTVNAVNSQRMNGTKNFASVLDSGETYFCPLYCTPTAGLVSWLGDDASSYRLLSAVFGILFLGLSYLLAQVFFANVAVSFLSTVFTAFSYWQIAWSRQARWYTMTEFFFWSALLLFYLFLQASERRQKYMYLAASALTTLLTIATHRLAYLLPIIMLIWYVIEKRPSKTQIGIAVLTVLGFLSIAELGFHFISHAIKNVQLHYTLPYYLNFYLREYWMFLILAVYGHFNIQKIESKKKFWMLATPFLLYLFFLSFFTNIVHYRYLFPMTVAMYILASIAMVNWAVKIKDFKKIRRAFFIVLCVFFISRHGLVTPESFYFLEADDPSHLDRPYYAYTPQPDFNAAYDAVQKSLKSDGSGIVISSHPHFNKILFGDAQYWLKYDYLGMEDTNKVITGNREYYVGASVVNNLDELKELTSSKHGYIIYDYMAADAKIPAETIEYIQKNFTLFFFDEKNSYSKIWVYRF